MHKFHILYVFLVCCLVSCDANRVFDSYKKVNNSNWHKNDIVSFNIQPPDSIKPYNLFVNLRTTNEYKYSNLFLIVSMNFPHGKTITDTLEYQMAKPTGELLGKGLMGVKEHKLWYKEHVKFNETGNYNVTIEQAMRQQGQRNGIIELEGITDVGFRIETVTQ